MKKTSEKGTPERLNALIASGEGETLEVKETTDQRVDAYETLYVYHSLSLMV